jgi:hypothetical protein
MQRLSIQKGHAFILAYSITNKQTFEELKPIYTQIREIKAEQQNETPILLMGCKSDEALCREITETLGKQLATYWSCAWIETSAKTNTNIREAFQELLKLDKKRQFNFNVDQDGHLIEDNSSTPVPSSPSPHGGKRTTTIISNSSTNNGSNFNMTETPTNPILTRPTTPVLHGNNSSRTSAISTSSTSTSNAKKGSRTTSEQTDLTKNSSGSKKTVNSDPSSNRAAARKCLIM